VLMMAKDLQGAMATDCSGGCSARYREAMIAAAPGGGIKTCE
jgi:hypothetical protein